VAFPEKVGFVVEFVRGQNEAENARFGEVGRRETKVVKTVRLSSFEKRIDLRLCADRATRKNKDQRRAQRLKRGKNWVLPRKKVRNDALTT